MKIARARYALFLGMVVCMTGRVYPAPQASSVPVQDSVSPMPAAKTTVSESGLKRLVFEEQKIEGKIRRPQLVLIKADQRPEFNPMVMQSLGKSKNIAALVDDRLLEGAQNLGTFKFEGTKIVTIEP
jgi:hypothetical protein